MSPVVLPRVYPSDRLSIGQLVHNPLCPTSNPYISQAPARPSELTEVRVEVPYKSLVSVDRKGRLTPVLHSESTARNYNLISVEADEAVYRSLRNPRGAFDTLREDPSARKWIMHMARHRMPFYFVIGVQELHNAKLRSLGVKDGKHYTASANTITNGVLGIEIMKVQGRVGSSTEPHLIEDIYWSWSYHRLRPTATDDDRMLSIGLGSVLRPEEIEQFHYSDEDESEGSYASSDEED